MIVVPSRPHHTSTAAFAELRCRTHYSFLRGASHPKEIVDRAAELGLEAVAITDRDGVYGIPKAYKASLEHSRLKLIVGAELTLGGTELTLGGEDLSSPSSPSFKDTELRRPHLPFLTLLATDRAAYGVLCRMITEGHRDKPKGQPALSWQKFRIEMERPGARGLIAIPEVRTPVNHGDFYVGLRELFPNRLYVPISRFLDGLDERRGREAWELARDLGVPLLATNDVHYHVPGRRPMQDALTAIRENVPLDRAGFKLFPNGERYLKSPEQMARLFYDLPEALASSLHIAEQCRFQVSELRYYYPSEWIPEGHSAESYLEELVWKGAEWRNPGGVPEDFRRQILHELGLIRELRFADYFLTIWEVVDFARKQKILCQGRGSAANSVVCYCLGITSIDPVRGSLLFERFISAERGEPPDIDVDFEHERREEVIQHIYEKYGRDRAGMVATLITYREKSTIRDLSKALGVSGQEVVQSPLYEQIRGFPRHLGIHSGGFTLSRDPLIETVPIEPARMEGRTIVQWDKDDLADVGLLKVDILALGMLSAIRKTFGLVERNRQVALEMASVPPEDPDTYRMIQNADTVGVFQIESRAQMSMLGRLLPKTFYDLVIEVAIVRPGPIVGDMVHPYLRRRRGLEPSTSPHPDLEPILRRTLGVPLFQEQVMRMAMTLGGFSPGEADELRRAIGSWRSSGTIDRLGIKLQAGFLAKGIPPEYVERLMAQIRGFAEYGFPESHAASFALLAYVSSYLKCHYPLEFCIALLNSQPMGFYSSYTLIEDARRHGVRVLPLDPNRSGWESDVEDGDKLRLGWHVARGVVEAEARLAIAERERRPFASVADFLARARLRRDCLFGLAMGGAFESFGLTQREALWEILAYRGVGTNGRARLVAREGEDEGEGNGAAGSSGETDAAAGEGRYAPAPFEPVQLGLFTGIAAESRNGAERLAPLDELGTIRADCLAYGMSTRGHPMGPLRKELGRAVPAMTTRGLKTTSHGSSVRIAGMIIVRQRPPTAKGTTFATLEDEEGFVDMILHKDVYERFHETFLREPFLVVSGRVQRDQKTVNLIVQHVSALNVDPGLKPRGRNFH